MFVLRVRIRDGVWADIPFHAENVNMAIKLCEAQYGSGSFMGIISQD
jgi:hypothetical protein